jgi:hypothetical protein
LTKKLRITTSSDFENGSPTNLPAMAFGFVPIAHIAAAVLSVIELGLTGYGEHTPSFPSLPAVVMTTKAGILI